MHRYAEWLREKVLKFKYLEDWYKVDNAVFKKNGGAPLLSFFALTDALGATLLNYYDNSFSKLLLSAYPDHEWQVGIYTMCIFNSILGVAVQKNISRLLERA